MAQTVAVGDPVTLSVAAYGAAPVLYQWQRKNVGAADFTDVPGAAAADFTIPAVRLEDDQTLFRARISNGSGTTNSQAVVLAVTSAPPPVPVIVEPAGATYRAGDTISLLGSATAGGGGRCRRARFCGRWNFIIRITCTRSSRKSAA